MRDWPPLVLFDLDDTLFDHRGSSQATLAAMGAAWPALNSLSPADLWWHYHTILEAMHPLVIAGQLDPDEARRRRASALFEVCGQRLSDAEAARFASDFRDRYQALRSTVAGADELLTALRGRTRVGIVSNNLTAEQEDKLAHLGLTHLIDFMVTSEDAGVAKPDPAIFRAALVRGGATAEQALLVGDNWEVDIVGGLGVGLRCIWFDREGEPRELPDGVERIADLHDLLR